MHSLGKENVNFVLNGVRAWTAEKDLYLDDVSKLNKVKVPPLASMVSDIFCLLDF